MQRFWWPGYEMQLLEQLQTQQNRAQFCDTLLQTEGISIPTHSCVLAALSPYLSQRLSDSPTPPLGQKRLLHLQEVTAHTLLKLVGLLYSGRLEVKSSKEQNDILAAAHKFGISDLVLGCRDGERKGKELLERGQGLHTGEGTEPRKGLEMQDVQVETEISGKTENDSLVQRKSFLSVGTQTLNDTLMSAASPGPLSDHTPPPTNSSASLLPQNISKFSLTPYLTVHSEPESTAGQSFDYLTHSSSFSASSRCRGTVPPVANDSAASSPASHEKSISRQLVEQERPGQEDGNATVDGGSCAQPSGVCRETTRGGEKEKSNSHLRRSGKNMDRMKEVEQMMDSAQISVKVKLRRRTKGEEWEIVEDADESASVPTNPNQSCSNRKPPQSAPKVVHTPARSVHPVQKPETLRVQPVFTSSPQPPKHANTSSDSEVRSSGWLSLSRSSELESEGRSPPQGPTEESDEKIDKLLENIIMSMSMLPDLGRSCRKTHANHDGVPTFCQVPGVESGAGPLSDVCAEQCVFYQDLGRQGSHSDTDTGLHYCFGAQNQPGYTNPSAAHTALQTEQPQHSEFRSFGPMDGLSWTGGESSPYPVSCFPSGQKLHDLMLQQPFCQEDQSIEFLSLSHESDSQSAEAFSLPTMEDLRLPQCLSPLVPPTGHQQSDTSASGRMENDVQILPWLTKTACMLTFPLNAITAGKTELLETGSDAEQSQSFRKLKLKNEGEAGSAKSVGQGVLKPKRERKTDAMKRKKNKQDAAEDMAPPKRRRRRRPDSWRELPKVSSLDPEVRNAATTVCSVSLSCNNVLMKQREIAISSLSNPPPASTATGNEKSREPGNLGAKQPRIRTRGFVKQSERGASSAVSDKCCVLIPVIHRAVIAHKQDPTVTKRKRGRPPKIKLEKFPEDAGAFVEIKGHIEAGEEISEKESPMEDVKCGKLMGTACEGEAGQLKRTASDESSGKNETDSMKSGEPQKQSWMVTLKEFQKLINRKHSKTRKGTEVQDRNKPEDVGDLEKQAEIDKSGASETHRRALFDAAVDENHIRLPNTSAAACKTSQQDAMSSSEARKSCGSGEEDKPASSCDVPEEEKLSATSLGEGDGGSTLSGCNGKEEDEEVDVILYSPDKFSTRELEERVVVIPDEEEEDEDVIEIDVIGDEGE
ncbi:PREDICTED: BTB/POZ domain-containing protein 18 [Poecilia mexicana]|nr:PREDICTED: BTB/POZ domain-containing protein 18 [Poecilia mexicana]